MARLRDENKIIDIYNATRKLLLQKGFNNVKMADVAKEAGVATGTLYIYFKTKEELIISLYIYTKEAIISSLINTKSKSTQISVLFKNMWYAYFDYCINNPECMLFVEQYKYSGTINESVITKTEKLMLPLYQFIENAQKEGVFIAGDVKIIEAQLVGPVHELVKLFINKRTPYNKKTIDQCFQMAWNSIRK